MKKNVLIIFTDQLRRDILGCYGGREDYLLGKDISDG